MLSINKAVDGSKAVFELNGRLDTISAPQLEREMQQSLGSVLSLTLDCAGLEYISSAGLRVLLEAQTNMMARAGELKLIHVGEVILTVFEITGFTDILTIE